jgi:multiple sugar transport system substrate-binding protein
MKQRTTILCLALLLSLGSTGCGGDSAQKDSRTVLRFVTWKPERPDVWDEAIGRFEAANPDLRIIREVGPHSSTEYHDLLAQKLKNRDTSVDVFLMDVIWPPEFGAAGWARPLDDLFPHAERRKFLDAPIVANTYRGRIYGVPAWIASGMLYYRKDLLDKYGFQPPVTWQELVEQANQILAKERPTNPNLQGYSGQFKQYEGLVCNMLEFIHSNGGEVLSADGRRSALATPLVVEAIEFVRDEIIGSIAPRGVLTYEEPESLSLFLQGNAIFHRNWPYAWERANDPEVSRVVGKVAISRLPYFPGGRSVSILGGWQYGISAFSENVDAAWRFVSFMTGPEVQKLFALGESRAPTRLSVYEDPEVRQQRPQFVAELEVFRSARPRPRSPLYPKISHILQRTFSTALSDPNSDIEALTRQAASEIDAVLQLLQQAD